MVGDDISPVCFIKIITKNANMSAKNCVGTEQLYVFFSKIEKNQAPADTKRTREGRLSISAFMCCII